MDQFSTERSIHKTLTELRLREEKKQEFVSLKQPLHPLSGRPLDKCLCKRPFLKAIETRRETAVWQQARAGVASYLGLDTESLIESLKVRLTVLLMPDAIAT